jgi:hypothetical protein
MECTGESQNERTWHQPRKTGEAVAHWLNGPREPRLEEIASMRRVLGIDKIDLLANGSVITNSDPFEFIGKPKEGLQPVKGEAVMGADAEQQPTTILTI